MSEMLVNMSNALAETVESAGGGTVRVEARRRMPATGIIWSADGVIVTAHHVVERDDHITVGLPNGESVDATLIGRDPSTDLAALQVKATGLTVLAKTAPDTLRVGHLVLALGRPGPNVLSTLGIISAVGDAWRTREGGQFDRYVQTDITMFPGFSGGPLIDMAGSVVGLNTSAMGDISLAVPTTTIQRVVETLLKHGKVKKGYLGVGAQPVKLPAALRDQLGQDSGLLLASVESDSPADKAGLMLGDTLVSLDGQSVRNMDDLAAVLYGDRVGRAIPVKIVRGGTVTELSVTIGERA